MLWSGVRYTYLTMSIMTWSYWSASQFAWLDVVGITGFILSQLVWDNVEVKRKSIEKKAGLQSKFVYSPLSPDTAEG